MSAFIANLARTKEAITVARYESAFALVGRFLDDEYTERVTIDRLSKQLLEAFYDWLAKGRHKKKRSLYTKRRIVEKLQGAWAWLFAEEWSEHVPRPKTIDMKREHKAPVRAPTFEESARCVKACLTDWVRKLATILYYTGVRTSQACSFTWDHVDMDNGTLTVQPHKGLAGRIIPLSPFFVAELARWGTREGRLCGVIRSHQLVERRLNEAWARAKVRKDVWTRAPGKAFRKCLTTGLAALGVDKERAELYVGRGIAGARARYVDVEALPLEDVAAKIPSIESFNITLLRAAKGAV